MGRCVLECFHLVPRPRDNSIVPHDDRAYRHLVRGKSPSGKAQSLTHKKVIAGEIRHDPLSIPYEFA